jgi:hypothetical protein
LSLLYIVTVDKLYMESAPKLTHPKWLIIYIVIAIVFLIVDAVILVPAYCALR